MKYFWEKFIDYIFRKKSIYTCLYITVVFFLSQLAALGQSAEIIKYCNQIQERNEDSWLFEVAQVIKILYANGNVYALVASGTLILIFIILIVFIKKKESNLDIDLVEIFEDGLL